jgi:hypothetical protein
MLEVQIKIRGGGGSSGDSSTPINEAARREIKIRADFSLELNTFLERYVLRLASR